MILEGLITTRAADGAPHLAALGPEVDARALRAGTLAELVLKPFASSHTAGNLAATPAGVFHTTDDVLVLARCVAGVGPLPAMVPAEAVPGWRLADACCAWEFSVVEADRSAERQRLTVRVERFHAGRPFHGHVRARHAVVEGAILVSRLHLLGAEEVAARLAELRVLVDKTGDADAHEAFAILADRAARPPAPRVD
jgi:hypothetical protein